MLLVGTREVKEGTGQYYVVFSDPVSIIFDQRKIISVTNNRNNSYDNGACPNCHMNYL